MGQAIYQVDAFSDRPFHGNPAAVCILDRAMDPSWMQDVAREMNLSETAFVSPHPDGFGLRWFTPKTEVELCGHATLASAHILWETGRLRPEETARFHTVSDLLTARRGPDGIELDFPSTPAAEIAGLPGLPQALGVEPVWLGKNRFDVLVQVGSEEQVRRLDPDFPALRRLSGRGFIVTSAAAAGPYDVVSRFFAPTVGIDEDPVTGSAHCCLGPFWAERLGKTELIAFQASARGGVVHVRVRGDRVGLGGRAVTVLRGTLVADEDQPARAAG